MADLPYIPLWADDYLADTYHLSLEEHGAYVMLLMLAWRTPGCSLPNDPDWIARRLRISREEFDRTVSPILLEFFTRRGSRWHQKRLSAEFARARERSQKQSGRAKSRWQKEKGAYRGNANQNHTHTHTHTQETPTDSETPSIRSGVRPTGSTHRERKSPDRRSESGAPSAETASPDHAAPDGRAADGRRPAQDFDHDHPFWTLVRVLRLELSDSTGKAANTKQENSLKRLARKYVAACGTEAISEIERKFEAGEIGDLRGYLVTSITNAEGNGKAKPRGRRAERNAKPAGDDAGTTGDQDR